MSEVRLCLSSQMPVLNQDNVIAMSADLFSEARWTPKDLCRHFLIKAPPCRAGTTAGPDDNPKGVMWGSPDAVRINTTRTAR
jgi:hypothetical protein